MSGKQKILIVDDEKPICDLIDMNLSAAGYQCKSVQDGLAAIDLIEQEVFDLILLDIKMPEMNGIDALKEIRKFDQDIPIIMQSAYAFENDMEAARQAGSNGFVTKPINIKELKSVLSSFLPQLTW